MKLINDGFFIFNQGFPIHTWYPILDGKLLDKSKNENNLIFEDISTENISKRSLYFHIPFCEGHICSFCSFPRKICNDIEEIDQYVNALIKEIEIKSQFKSVGDIPVHAIFFGGGTPSILTVAQITRIGNSIAKNFNLSKLVEFSFENNIHSVTEEKLQALQSIGVTHVRAGVQSLNQKYREYFDLLPSINEVHEKINLMKKYFDNVCIDIIYGINDQTIEELITDIHNACMLDTKQIDFYPLTQPKGNMKLKRLFTEKGLKPKSELELIGLGIILKEVLKDYGYYPYSGHGFVKLNDENNKFKNMTQDYSFEYHKSTMGYADGDVVGFGSGASSKFINYGICNTTNINEYIKEINKGTILCDVYEVDESLHYSKGITTHLPYFGYSLKKEINLDKIHKEVLINLKLLIDSGIVIENDDKYIICDKGWYWDNVIMYFLSPNSERNILDSIIEGTIDPNLYKFK